MGDIARLTTAAVFAAATTIGCASMAEADGSVRHVLLLSVDGLHAVDLANFRCGDLINLRQHARRIRLLVTSALTLQST